MTNAYDLIVIGAGPGGYPAALRAAALGKKTAVIERRELGGTCLNRGCIPTKTLLHTSSIFREVLNGRKIGIEVPTMSLNPYTLQDRKNEVVGSLQKGIAAQLKKSGVDVYYGTGTIENEHLVSVVFTDASQEPVSLESEHILIATGSVSSTPPIPGSNMPGVVNSDQLLETIDVSPLSLIIIGGGVIGMEFAQIYSDIGSPVTVLEAMDRILPGMDKEIAQNLKMIGKKRSIEIHTGAKVREIRKDGLDLACEFEEKGEIHTVTGERVLIATGRRPDTSGLFSEAMKGRIAENRGCIQVDESYCTSVPGIYAIGDVIGGIQLAHAATAEGVTAVERMYGQKLRYDTSLIPSCVYTDPEIAVIGWSADEAKEAGIETITGKYIMSTNGKSLLSDQERGFIKLVARKDNHQLIGAQMMCARATDMISQVELAIKNHMTVEQLAEIVLPHPTFCEGIGEAAFEASGR